MSDKKYEAHITNDFDAEEDDVGPTKSSITRLPKWLASQVTAGLVEGEDSRSRRLQDRVAVVTGGGGTNSIGRAICLRYAQEGARVGVLDLDGVGAARVADEIVGAGGVALPVICDVTDRVRCEAAVREVAGAFGSRIDILVNNAAFFGRMGPARPFNEWTTEEWDQMMEVNVRGMWFCVQAVFPYMKAQGYGKIINLSSSTFFEGVSGLVHYTTSKGAVVGLTRSLARELAEYGIRVNAIAPGYTLSDAQLGLQEGSTERSDINRTHQALAERNELPEDMAGPTFFLASSDSDFITGQTLLVDGGRTPH